jgi:hypothetical protein
MTIEEIIKFVSNKVTNIESKKTDALSMGDIERYNDSDNELEETKSTLRKLNKISTKE